MRGCTSFVSLVANLATTRRGARQAYRRGGQADDKETRWRAYWWLWRDARSRPALDNGPKALRSRKGKEKEGPMAVVQGLSTSPITINEEPQSKGQDLLFLGIIFLIWKWIIWRPIKGNRRHSHVIAPRQKDFVTTKPNKGKVAVNGSNPSISKATKVGAQEIFYIAINLVFYSLMCASGLAL